MEIELINLVVLGSLNTTLYKPKLHEGDLPGTGNRAVPATVACAAAPDKFANVFRLSLAFVFLSFCGKQHLSNTRCAWSPDLCHSDKRR